MPRNPVLTFRLPEHVFNTLTRERQLRHLNVSGWARAAVLEAFQRDFPDAAPSGKKPAKRSGSTQDAPAASNTAETPRAADRELLGRAPLPSPNSEPIPGFCPAQLPDQTWGARFEGDPAALPAELVGLRIRIKAKSSGNTWDGTVTETINKDDGSVLFRYADKADPA